MIDLAAAQTVTDFIKAPTLAGLNEAHQAADRLPLTLRHAVKADLADAEIKLRTR